MGPRPGKKKMKKTIAVMGLVSAMVIMLAGCNTTTTKYDKDTGKVIEVKSSDSPLKDKSMAMGGSFTAVKLESTGSTTSGTPTANFCIGGGTAGLSSSPKEDDRPVVSVSWSAGILSSVTSASASSGTVTYIGTKGETAEQTEIRINALLKLKNAEPSSSTTTDSTTSN